MVAPFGRSALQHAQPFRLRLSAFQLARTLAEVLRAADRRRADWLKCSPSGRIMTSFASILIRQAREEISAMNDWLSVELARERNAGILAEAEERRLGRLAP